MRNPTRKTGVRAERGDHLTIIEVEHPEYWAPKLRGKEIEMDGVTYTFVRILSGNRLLVKREDKKP